MILNFGFYRGHLIYLLGLMVLQPPTPSAFLQPLDFSVAQLPYLQLSAEKAHAVIYLKLSHQPVSLQQNSQFQW